MCIPILVLCFCRVVYFSMEVTLCFLLILVFLLTDVTGTWSALLRAKAVGSRVHRSWMVCILGAWNRLIVYRLQSMIQNYLLTIAITLKFLEVGQRSSITKVSCRGVNYGFVMSPRAKRLAYTHALASQGHKKWLLVLPRIRDLSLFLITWRNEKVLIKWSETDTWVLPVENERLLAAIQPGVRLLSSASLECDISQTAEWTRQWWSYIIHADINSKTR